MKRSPMNRRTPKAVEWAKKRSALKRTLQIAQKSVRIKKRDAARKRPHADQLREFPFCEAKAAGMEHECAFGLTVHEPYTKARGGPQDDRRNMTTVCGEGNRLISQDAAAMAWAEEHGFLVSQFEGAAWLAAGGFKRSESET